MAMICVIVDDIFPGSDDNHVTVNYRWFASDGVNSANETGNGEFVVSVSAVLNQSVIDASVAASALLGVTIGPSDRKLIHGFA